MHGWRQREDTFSPNILVLDDSFGTPAIQDSPWKFILPHIFLPLTAWS